jgi:hypothetical protein
MAEKETTTPPPGHHTISGLEDEEIRYWAEKWDISQEQLRKAIAHVGTRTEALAQYFGKQSS